MGEFEDKISCATHATSGFQFSYDSPYPRLFSTTRRAVPQSLYPTDVSLMPDIRSPYVLLEDCDSAPPLFLPDIKSIAAITPESIRTHHMKIWHDTRNHRIAHAHIDRTVMPPPFDAVRFHSVPMDVAMYFVGALGGSLSLHFSTDAGLTLLAAGNRSVLHLGPGERNSFMPAMSHTDKRDGILIPACTYDVTSDLDSSMAPFMYSLRVSQTSNGPVSDKGKIWIAYTLEATFSSFRFEDIQSAAMATLESGDRNMASFDPLFDARATSLEMDYIPA